MHVINYVNIINDMKAIYDIKVIDDTNVIHDINVINDQNVLNDMNMINDHFFTPSLHWLIFHIKPKISLKLKNLAHVQKTEMFRSWSFFQFHVVKFAVSLTYLLSSCTGFFVYLEIKVKLKNNHDLNINVSEDACKVSLSCVH
jgi:hypothetical protein